MSGYFPQREANNIAKILRTVGVNEFPVDVRTIAREISLTRFPDDPITMIKGALLPGFEGALAKAPENKTGWGIIYNNALNAGRINFTLGHEFGHYLMHRLDYPKGFQCSTEDMARWESEYGQREHEANVFAATLLMPFDDFRKQLDSKKRPDLDLLGHCADRYDVSLLASTLRWLQYTTRRSLLVVSRDEFVLWARSSKPALKTGLYYKIRDRSPVAIPVNSAAANVSKMTTNTGQFDHDANAWFSEPCTEHVLASDQYDFVISLIHFGDAEYRDPESEDDTLGGLSALKWD